MVVTLLASDLIARRMLTAPWTSNPRLRARSNRSADLDEILVRQRFAGKLSELAADGERPKIDADEADPVDQCHYFRLCCVVVAGIEQHAPAAIRSSPKNEQSGGSLSWQVARILPVFQFCSALRSAKGEHAHGLRFCQPADPTSDSGLRHDRHASAP